MFQVNNKNHRRRTFSLLLAAASIVGANGQDGS
jgi:hypothetical protein